MRADLDCLHAMVNLLQQKALSLYVHLFKTLRTPIYSEHFPLLLEVVYYWTCLTVTQNALKYS